MNYNVRLYEALKKKNMTISFAESCTGGLMSAWLTDVAGASEVTHASVVTYSDEMKNKLIGVKKETLEKFTAVSPQTAMEMALGVAKLTGANIGVSVTGYAGPNQPCGYAYAGISINGEVSVYKITVNDKFKLKDKFYDGNKSLSAYRMYMRNTVREQIFLLVYNKLK